MAQSLSASSLPKNDSFRTEFGVRIPGGSHPKSDPVHCLKVYIDRTVEGRRQGTVLLFLSLRHPYDPVGSYTIAKLLNRAIELAGLDRAKYSAKNFRPSAATAAVESRVPVETAVQLGRWKTTEVFLNHYVHPGHPVITWTHCHTAIKVCC